MKKFRVSLSWSISGVDYVYVDADTPSEAAEEAKEDFDPSLASAPSWIRSHKEVEVTEIAEMEPE